MDLHVNAYDLVLFDVKEYIILKIIKIIIHKKLWFFVDAHEDAWTNFTWVLMVIQNH
jgi:hypothetical protein